MKRRSEARPWNHNIAYHRFVLNLIPVGAKTALDVGTGDGLLAGELLLRVPEVVGIDLDADVLARARSAEPRVRWVLGDIEEHGFSAGSFDLVASIAALHHLRDPGAGLRVMGGLVAPGGVLVVVGVACSTSLIDLAFDLAGTIRHRVDRRRYGWWEHSAPTVWPPRHSFRQMRRIARRALPGSRWRRLALWRYAIVWEPPPAI